MNPTIFISYARANEDFVRKLADFLRLNGFDVWFDKDSLLAGDDWQSVIFREISNARIFLVCFSAESMDHRGYFHKEMRIAMDVAQTIPPNVLYIVPIRINHCPIPEVLSRYHVLSAFDNNGWQADLLKSLRRSFPESQEETGTITVNTRPIAGPKGHILTMSYDPERFVFTFLNQIYYSLTGFVREYTYGTVWCLRDDKAGDLYDAANEDERIKLRFATLKDVGFQRGMKLSTVWVRDYPGHNRRLPKPE